MLELKQNDIEYLEELQRDYENTINYYEDIAEHMKLWQESINTNSHFLTKNGLIHDIKEVEADEVNKTTKYFIEYILRYFENNYGLSSLTSYIQGNIVNKYIKYTFTKTDNSGLHYKHIIKDICDALNINDLDSAKVKDLRTRITDKTRFYFKENRIAEGNNKLKITDMAFHLDYNWSDTHCGLTDNSKNIFIDIATALNYKLTGKLLMSDDFKNLLDILAPSNWNNRMDINNFHKTYDIKRSGVLSIRFYKNRSLEIKFFNDKDKDIFIKVLRGEF